MDRYSIAAQLYTLRDYLKTPEEISETLKKVHEIGYHAVQVSGMGPVDPMRLKEIVDGLDIKICATHISYDRLKNNLDNVIREHKLWECEYVGLGSMPQQYATSRDGYMEFIKDISVVAERVTQSGLKFVYHNHNFEFEKFDGRTGFDILFDETEPADFGFEVDTYWVQAGGANPVDLIKKVKGRMGIVHFKDMAMKNGQQVFSEIGEGNLDWDTIIKSCRETGVKWYAIEQDICQRNPFDSLEMSLRYLETFI
jgi:Xylose isomerase-like TIM barrel.